MALLPKELVESFAILDALIADCESHGICISLSLNTYTTAISHYLAAWEAPRKPVLTGQLYPATMIVLSQP